VSIRLDAHEHDPGIGLAWDLGENPSVSAILNEKIRRPAAIQNALVASGQWAQPQVT
jgi:hypothetical protein